MEGGIVRTPSDVAHDTVRRFPFSTIRTGIRSTIQNKLSLIRAKKQKRLPPSFERTKGKTIWTVEALLSNDR
jgi:hypothetical protein